jgi:hypothetical protein
MFHIYLTNKMQIVLHYITVIYRFLYLYLNISKNFKFETPTMKITINIKKTSHYTSAVTKLSLKYGNTFQLLSFQVSNIISVLYKKKNLNDI